MNAATSIACNSCGDQGHVAFSVMHTGDAHLLLIIHIQCTTPHAQLSLASVCGASQYASLLGTISGPLCTVLNIMKLGGDSAGWLSVCLASASSSPVLLYLLFFFLFSSTLTQAI